MAKNKIPAVDAMTQALHRLLDAALRVKQSHDIDPPLTMSSIGHLLNNSDEFSALSVAEIENGEISRQTFFPRFETAARDVFDALLSSTAIESPAFVRMWNLLDIVSIFSDQEKCEPGLIFWLIEELLDSQTIEGCRKVFDYLESRRERITARHFKQKNLVILRSCNELLRRLSRAENTVFCGRVFIFLFQSFPLGDKSSVNLRGEYHVENTTSYEDRENKRRRTTHGTEDRQESADLRGPSSQGEENPTDEGINGAPAVSSTAARTESTVASVQANGTSHSTGQPVDLDTLYPIFWSLQEHFSNPTRLFSPENLQAFKTGLDMTLAKFKELRKDPDGKNGVRMPDDSKRGVKRKRGEMDEYMASNFNPKYLTSRDLFELELNDLAFRRHILVQALILLDFLLSLTPKEKAKLAELNLQNKSVQYQFTLEDDVARWATETKSTIAAYLQNGPEGKFYYRMVDTVLSRDKNWVRWKAESCPSIERAPVMAAQWVSAREDADRACAVRKIRSTPLGSLDLSCLTDHDNKMAMEWLKDPQRYAVPEIESFHDAIVEADEKIKDAKDDVEKEIAVDAKASLMWRALRLASKSRLALFDKLETDVQDLRPIYRRDWDGFGGDENHLEPPAHVDVPPLSS